MTNAPAHVKAAQLTLIDALKEFGQARIKWRRASGRQRAKLAGEVKRLSEQRDKAEREFNRVRYA